MNPIDTPLTSLGVSTLRAALTSRGIAFPSRAPKADLVSLLTPAWERETHAAVARQALAEARQARDAAEAAAEAIFLARFGLTHTSALAPYMGVYILRKEDLEIVNAMFLDEFPEPTRQTGALAIGGGRDTAEYVTSTLYRNPNATIVVYGDPAALGGPRVEVWQ